MGRFTGLALILCLLVSPSVTWAQTSLETVRTMPFGNPGSIAVAGDLGIYGISNGIMVVDIADPASPARLSRLSLPGEVHHVTVEGNLVYVAAGSSGIVVVDLTEPTAPSIVRMIDTPGDASDVAVADGRLFVADGDGGFRSLDLGAGSPEWNVVGVPSAARVALDGQKAVVGGNPDTWVIDVSVPGQMVPVGVIPHRASDVEIAGCCAWLGAGDDGLLVFDLADPANPVHIGTFSPAGSVLAIDHADGLVWLTNDDYPGFRGVRVVDVSVPSNPVEIGSIDLGAAYFDVRVNGPMVHLGWDTHRHSEASYSLPILNGSDPTRPVRTGVVLTSGTAARIDMVGDLAFVGVGYDDGFQSRFMGVDIIDFSTPAAPRELAGLTAPDTVVGYSVDGATAVLVDDSETLLIYDISTPADPVRTGASVLPRPVQGVALAGNHVFLADDVGIRVFDIGDPASPAQVGFTQTSSMRWPTPLLRVAGGQVYAGYYVSAWEGYTGGVLVVDVSDPSAPAEIGNIGLGCPVELVQVGDRMFTLEL